MKAKEPAIFFSIIAINKMLQKFKKKKTNKFWFSKGTWIHSDPRDC